MQAFAALYAELDASTATNTKLAALVAYFKQVDAADAAWAAYFLAGGKPRQSVPTKLLRAVGCKLSHVPDWLFEECYQAVGDLAETITYLLPPSKGGASQGLAYWVEHRIVPLRGMQEDELQAQLISSWQQLPTSSHFIFNKLITGGFRVGVSKLLLTRALAQVAELDAKLVAQRFMGYTDIKTLPTKERYLALLQPASEGAMDNSQPYPFFLAHALNEPVNRFDELLGAVSDWQVEWKYDGIRAQVVKRGGEVALWSRGEELMTERFPEVIAQMQALPDGTVIDGELLVWLDDRPASFALLQQRIGRKRLTKSVLSNAPVVLLAYDLLESEGQDIRSISLLARRKSLSQLCTQYSIRLSPTLQAQTWEELAVLRASSRERGVEGFMLKANSAAYGVGRTKEVGLWWKWKIEPMTVDCVLIYAQAGHGRRASLYTDYTFAVWSRTPRDADEAQAVLDNIAAKQAAQPDGLQLLPFAKAYSGLTDEEFKQVDAVIRKTTLEKFGPVRSVKPSLVFELGFEGINRSPRHKSGIAVRFPRMLRIRHDKPLHEADTLGSLESLLCG